MRISLIGLLVFVLAETSVSAAPLTAADVNRIVLQGARSAASVNSKAIIAVVDREGFVLGVYNTGGMGGAISTALAADAISKAGTAAFLSSNQNAFTSRTAGYITQNHFPPGVVNAPPGPLVGVGFSQLPFSDVNRFRSSLTPAVPIAGTSLRARPGGVPLYSGGVLVGGVGVTSSGGLSFNGGLDKDEEVALVAQSGFAPSPGITADKVFINGIRLAYVMAGYKFTTKPATFSAARYSPLYPPVSSTGAPPNAVVPATFGGNPGQLRNPIVGSALGPLSGQPRLSAAEVTRIISAAAARTSITRAGIRLPVGVPAQLFISVVDNPNMAGAPPPILGVFRTGDAPIFSYDVSVQKARTALFFSTRTLALSTRAVGFLGVDLFPPGINHTAPGPYFGLQQRFSTAPANMNLPNGITIFPGGFPLYRNGVMIGAIGVSGDGVDQDDLVAAAGTVNFLAPYSIRSDQFTFRNARLPYAKFPRDSSL